MPKQVEVDDDSKINYKDANNYWDNVESSVNGMLGGWSVLTEPDARDSNQFYADFSSNINSKICCGIRN